MTSVHWSARLIEGRVVPSSPYTMIPIEARLFSIHNHASHAFQVMSELRQKQELCDIVISVEGRKFHAHKVVLAGCSPYLRAMFTNGMLETDKNTVEIHGIEPATMDMLLDFVYNGSVEVTIENVQLLLQGASMLNLISLRNVCCHFLQQHLDASNCLGIHSFADMFSCVELEAGARRYIYQHFLKVIQHEEFLLLDEARLIKLLQSDQLQVTSEEEVFGAAVQWLSADPEGRGGEVACRVLQCVRYALLDTTFLTKSVLHPDAHTARCERCRTMVTLATKAKEDNNVLASIASRAQPLGIFVIGGRNVTYSQLKSMERYDFLRDKWIPMSNMSIARTAISAASLEGQLYTVGGECALAEPQDDTQFLRCVERYDPMLKEWTRLADIKVARSFLSTVSVGGYLYALGGEDRTNTFNVVERYDPKANSWTFVPCMRQKRAGAGVAVCDGRIYIAGGHDKTFQTDRASVECYDLESCEWSFVAEMENPRSGLVLVAVDHYLYAIGGRTRYHLYFDVAERYDLLTNQWTTVSHMISARAWPAVAVIDKKIYVMGGFDGNNRLRSAEVYDPETDQWTSLSNMKVSRAGCAAAVL